MDTRGFNFFMTALLAANVIYGHNPTAIQTRRSSRLRKCES